MTGTLIKEMQHILPPAPELSSTDPARMLPRALGSEECIGVCLRGEVGKGTSRAVGQ